MSTENENILKGHIEQLHTSMNTMASYIMSLTATLNQNNSGACSSYSQQFYDQQQVTLYLPFCAGMDTTITVMVEEIPGKHRQIMPMITNGGTQITVDFDRPYTGTVRVMNDLLPPAVTIPTVPYFDMNTTCVSLYEPADEPAYEEPKEPTMLSNVTEIFPTQKRTIGEIITQDIDRAMGVLD